MKRRQKRVLIALGWYDYRLHSGIEKYAQEHGWYLSANLAREKVIPWGWEGDGILAWLGAGDDLAEFVQSEKKPTVWTSSLRRGPPELPARPRRSRPCSPRWSPSIFTGAASSISSPAASTRSWSYDERGAGFVAALQQMGQPYVAVGSAGTSPLHFLHRARRMEAQARLARRRK